VSVIKSSLIVSLVLSGLLFVLNENIPPWAVLPMCIAAICSLIIFNIEAFRIRKLIGRLAAYLDIVIIMTLVEIEIFETMDIITIILLWATGLLLAGLLVIIFINIYKKRKDDEYFSVFDLISFEVILIILFVGSYFVSGYPYHPVETAASGQSSLPAPTSTQSSDTIPPPVDYGSYSESFRCPEDYQTEEEKTQNLLYFMASYRKQYPASTTEQLMIARYHLLATNLCEETLANMSQQVDPDYSPMISFMDKNFGPRTIEFDNETNVLTAYYPQNNQNLEDSSNGELIFDFFIKGFFASTTV